MELKNSKTFDHLARAFAGECMARTRYEFAEYGARKAGYDNIAAIIDEIAYQEFNHARSSIPRSSRRRTGLCPTSTSARATPSLSAGTSRKT